MSRVCVFSAIYVGIRSVKWPHLGVVGNILGKEMGKDFWCRFHLNNPANPVSPFAASDQEIHAIYAWSTLKVSAPACFRAISI
jgi:hypothetical protein